MRYYITALIVALTLVQCARPCPKDIKIGEMGLGATTKSFLPASQAVKMMTFTNAAGATLTFNSIADGAQTYDLPVETLCERGDYLDKTTQVKYFKVNVTRWDYKSSDDQYTLQVQLELENLGNYATPQDTIFLEKFSAWGQKLTPPIGVGTLSVMTDQRGNAAKITDQQRFNVNQYQLVADTVLAGRTIKNAYIPKTDGTQSLYVFYTKEKGIEAVTTGTEVWLRTQ